MSHSIKLNFNDTKGNWEYSDFQKPPKRREKKQHEEQNIKMLLSNTTFDPKKIDSYVNPQPSREELLMLKDKLNTTEKAQVENYKKKIKQTIDKDIANVREFKLKSEPETKEGRRLKMLMVLEHKLSKNLSNDVIMIHLRFKEPDFELSEENKTEFKLALNKMNNIVKVQDLIQYQFTVSYNQMPPLNAKGFTKLDPWQIEFVNSMSRIESTLICTPTSSGKSLLASYLTTLIKENHTMIIIAPTPLLVWQSAATWGKILDLDIPIITDDYQTIPRRDEFITLLNKSSFIAATPESLIDFLPLLSIKVQWLVLDEIHTIGMEEGSGMEQLLKVFSDVPFLGLSATIGELDLFKAWIESINPERKVKSIVSGDRYFNFDLWNYNSQANSLELINPLAMVSLQDFKDGTVLEKHFQPTPQNTWSLYIKLKEVYGDLGSLNHTNYFDKEERIHLNKATSYFFALIKFMVEKYEENKINNVLSSFSSIKESESNDSKLVDLTLLLKQEKKLPILIFNNNTDICINSYRDYLKEINRQENERFPRLMSQRMKAYKKYIKKQKDDLAKKITTTGKESDKKEKKQFLKEDEDDETEAVSLQEPTDDFTFNDNQVFTEEKIKEIADKLKQFYPYSGENYNYVIHGLWRGIGIISEGLPEPSNRLIQNLANEKKLAVVFTDKTMRFGISMPFKSVGILNDSGINKLDSMSYHQMAGRAGRRGLETQANIIFINYKLERIKELSICPLPKIVGRKTINVSVPHATKLAQLTGNSQNWESIFKNPLRGDALEHQEILESIKSNYEEGWNFALCDDKNHLHMMWRLRNCSDSDDPIRISFILPYLRRAFEGVDPNIEMNQIAIAHFLSHFINIKETSDQNVLPLCSILEKENFNNIFDILEEKELTVPSKINSDVFLSIKSNQLLKTNERKTVIIRSDLIKFGKIVKIIQHFCYHSKLVTLARLLAKLCTRIFWILHTSSPIMKKINIFEETYCLYGYHTTNLDLVSKVFVANEDANTKCSDFISKYERVETGIEKILSSKNTTIGFIDIFESKYEKDTRIKILCKIKVDEHSEEEAYQNSERSDDDDDDDDDINNSEETPSKEITIE